MTDRESNPDSPARDERDDPRSDIEQAVESRSDDVERAGKAGRTSPLDPPGQPDGVGGTGGVTKNQEDDAQ